MSRRTAPRPRNRHNGIEVTVVFPDTHIQAKGRDRHDPAAISVALQLTRDIDPDRIIQVGDLMNLECISSHNKNIQMGGIVNADGELISGDLSADYDMTNTFLDYFDEAAPHATDKVILEGNHDYWMWFYRNYHVPQPLRSAKVLQLPKMLKLQERGFKWVPYGTKASFYRVGKLDIIHGDYTNQYHAAKTINARGRNVMYGHTHEVQVHSQTNMNGLCRAWSIGCLRTLEAPFMRGRANSWSHAIAVIYTFPNGNFSVFIVDIIDGVAYWDGKKYQAKRLPGLE